MFDFASDLKTGDAAVFITYSKYSRLMYLTAEMVHKQGASIILLTDSLPVKQPSLRTWY